MSAPSPASRPEIEAITIVTPDGLRLQAELRVPGNPRATAVLCHPHPLYGGNMYNNVVSGLFDHLTESGVACLRFNFRGSGSSEGEHGQGHGPQSHLVAEQADVLAGVDEMTGRWPNLPLLMAGYSFGADVSLAVDDDRIGGWLAVAPPLRIVSIEDMTVGADERPKRLATGTEDEFRSADDARAATAEWRNTAVTEVNGANHFFMTGMDTVVQVASELAAELAGP